MLKRAAIVTAAVLMAVSGAAAQDASQPAKPAPAKAPKAAAAPTLKVGDRAPALSIEKWVKGEPVTGFEKGRVYVVEFWATWCGPCIASMPHLSALQKQYKKDGVTIIGVTAKDPGNPLEAVEKMVQEKGDGMGYTVAWDTGRETYNAYMKAAGQGGIPTSFLVDREGKIAYIGHPMWLDLPLEGVVKGTWDPVKGEEQINKAQQAMTDIFQASRSDPKGALTKIAQFETDYPAAAEMLGDMKYAMMVKAGDPGASALGRKMVDNAVKHSDAMKLNQIAWGIVDPEAKNDKMDLELAMLAASKGVELSKEKDAAVIDTLARVHFCKGDVAKAIEWQKKAIAVADEQMKESLEATLKEYEAAKK